MKSIYIWFIFLTLSFLLGFLAGYLHWKAISQQDSYEPVGIFFYRGNTGILGSVYRLGKNETQ